MLYSLVFYVFSNLIKVKQYKIIIQCYILLDQLLSCMTYPIGSIQVIITDILGDKVNRFHSILVNVHKHAIDCYFLY